MKHLFIFLLFIFLPASKEIAMSGVRINDRTSALNKVRLKLVGTDHDFRQYRSAAGNDLIVAIRDGRIAYLEEDWGRKDEGAQPLYSAFEYGHTTMKEIRDKFGSDGFGYGKNASFTRNHILFHFNCYEMNSPNNEVLITVTQLPEEQTKVAADVADKPVLIGLILTTKPYLDEVWGKVRTIDEHYRKIDPL